MIAKNREEVYRAVLRIVRRTEDIEKAERLLGIAGSQFVDIVVIWSSHWTGLIMRHTFPIQLHNPLIVFQDKCNARTKQVKVQGTRIPSSDD